MTNQLLQETRLSLTTLAHEQHVSVPTAWRWAQRGNRGHVLETFSIGGRKFTTREAFQRWIARINSGRLVLAQTAASRARSIQRAEQIAAELGA